MNFSKNGFLLLERSEIDRFEFIGLKFRVRVLFSIWSFVLGIDWIVIFWLSFFGYRFVSESLLSIGISF